MEGLISLKKFCAFYYQDELEEGQEPTKNMQDAVSRMCRNKVLPAVKLGSRWFIDSKKIESEER